jgi:hypothetical protein
MKLISVLSAALILSLPLLTSCSTLNWSSAAKSGPAVEAEAEDDERSWAERNIPGWEALLKRIPPPTEARKKWDRQQNKRRQTGNREMSLD